MRYSLWSGSFATASALILLPFGLPRGTGAVLWGLLGWMATGVVGVAGGAFMVSRHGTSGPGFLMILGVCMLLRLLLSAVGAVAAVGEGMQAVWPYLIGLVAGFIPVQIVEIVWFLRNTPGTAVGARG